MSEFLFFTSLLKILAIPKLRISAKINEKRNKYENDNQRLLGAPWYFLGPFLNYSLYYSFYGARRVSSVI